jgi:transitional endoplasmic reticulum ATPase
MTGTTRTTLPKTLRRLALHTAEEFDAARLALRLLLCGLSQHRLERLIDRSWDDDWYELIGVEFVRRSHRSDFEDHKTPVSRSVLKAQLAWLESQPRSASDRITSGIDELADILRLDDTDKTVLHMAALIERSQTLKELVDVCQRSAHGLRPHDLIANSLGLPRQAVKRSIARAGRLQRYQLLEASRHCEFPDLDDAFLSWLNDDDDSNIDNFLKQRLRKSPVAKLAPADFPHLPDLERMRHVLATAVEQRRAGINVLIYGAPGTGKTELVRVLARLCGVELFEVPVADSEGDGISGNRRFGAFAFAQRLMAEHGNAAMLFDEVEDVFGPGAMHRGFFAFNADYRPVKGWINEQLESNPVPTFWLSNDIGAIDPAHIRRFDEVIELRTPPVQVRRRIVARHFAKGLISPPCAERIATIDCAPPAQIERAARVVATLPGNDVGARDAAALRLLENSLRAMRVLRHLPKPVLPAHYDPSVLNTGADLDAIVTRLQRRPSARLCLYGPPGTGKTAFAHHLAERLQRPIHVCRASDLLSMWLGQTEERIAAAFRAAADDGAVLLIDEADSFLRDREGAQRSWEVTQVNEMLTQMEHFDGVFIASTNLLEQLDAASLRRFDYKLKFSALTREQRRRLFQRLCADLALPEPARIDAAQQRIDALDLLTPGDFAVLRRQFHGNDDRQDPMTLAALLEAETAIKPEARRRPIGFRPH